MGTVGGILRDGAVGEIAIVDGSMSGGLTWGGGGLYRLYLEGRVV